MSAVMHSFSFVVILLDCLNVYIEYGKRVLEGFLHTAAYSHLSLSNNDAPFYPRNVISVYNKKEPDGPSLLSGG